MSRSKLSKLAKYLYYALVLCLLILIAQELILLGDDIAKTNRKLDSLDLEMGNLENHIEGKIDDLWRNIEHSNSRPALPAPQYTSPQIQWP